MRRKVRHALFSAAYWVLGLTWGGLVSWPGLLVFLFLAATGHKVHRNGCSFIVETGGNWGGLELGVVSCCGSYDTKDGPCYAPEFYEYTRRHEFGHAVQQMIFGPLQFFLVGIPSIARYWHQAYRSSKGLPNEEYDQAWFEYTASKWGHQWVNELEGTDFPYTFVRKKRGSVR